jgi:hypothetical protein
MYHKLTEASLYTQGRNQRTSDRKYHKPESNNKSICDLQNNKININFTKTLYVSLVAGVAKVTNGLLVNEILTYSMQQSSS